MVVDEVATIDDVSRRISTLGIQIEQLEEDGKGDKRIDEEVATLVAERRRAQDQLGDLLEAARGERDAREAAVEAAAADREFHLACAKDLGSDRGKAAERVDTALAAFATALADWHNASAWQANSLMSAGNKPAADAARPRARQINAALVHALREANVPHAALDLPAQSPSTVMLLAESDPVAI